MSSTDSHNPLNGDAREVIFAIEAELAKAPSEPGLDRHPCPYCDCPQP